MRDKKIFCRHPDEDRSTSFVGLRRGADGNGLYMVSQTVCNQCESVWPNAVRLPEVITEVIEENLIVENLEKKPSMEKEASCDKSVSCRKRKPQGLEPCFGTPVPFSSQEIESRIDAICGCKGKYDCDCVSVFGQARMELWTEHNAKKYEKQAA